MNDSFDTMSTRNASLMEAYARMRQGQAKSSRHIALCEKVLTESQAANRDVIIESLKAKEVDFKKKYGNDWESVVQAIATKQSLSEDLNSSDVGLSNSLVMPTSVAHKKIEDDDIHSHIFDGSQSNLDAVHSHIKSLGFIPAGLPDNFGSHSEQKYTHPSGMVAYVGKTPHTGYLDVTNK